MERFRFTTQGLSEDSRAPILRDVAQAHFNLEVTPGVPRRTAWMPL